MQEKKTITVLDCCSFVCVNNLVITITVFVNKMAHGLTRYSNVSKTAHFIDCFIITWSRVGLIKDTRVYRSAAVDVKSKDYHRIVSKVKLKLKFRERNYHWKPLWINDNFSQLNVNIPLVFLMIKLLGPKYQTVKFM